MWKIHRRTSQLIVAGVVVLSTAGTAVADQVTNSFQLPGVTLPSGSDEVRAADGTSCRSAIGNAGAYLDVGVIGNPGGLSGGTTSTSTDGSASAYGRIVIPLGRQRERVDCTRLYDLEVRRLELELRLMEMGLGRPIEGTNASEEAVGVDDEFSGDEWSDVGLNES